MELTQIPEGYHLQTFDDCGVRGCQPHVPGNAAHTFAESAVQADLKARTVTYGGPHFDMVFGGLADGSPYVLAVTYASEKGNRRVQSLSAGPAELHGPRALPDGSAERLFYRIPPAAIEDGHLILHFRCHEGPNAVVSAVELWSARPSPALLRLVLEPHINGSLGGRVLDLSCESVSGATVTVREGASGQTYGSATTTPDGGFEVDLSAWAIPGAQGVVEVTAKSGDVKTTATVQLSDLCFLAPRFRPIPKQVEGLGRPQMCLDGTWLMNPEPPEGYRGAPPDGSGWSILAVPGQWLQQGFDVPGDRAVAIVKEFRIPRTWAAKRVFLRFEAVHGRADYWLNGHHIGYSANLFTPIEFDTTNIAHVGQTNLLALAIRVQTASEAASFSSDYAFHNLGGIDRSVWVYALPPIHIASLHHEVDLDSSYQDATLSLSLSLANTTEAPAPGLSLCVRLERQDGKATRLTGSILKLDTLQPGRTTISKQFPVSNPLKWSAEKPRLYRLHVELYRGDALLERVEHNVGFRKIEVKGSQLLINSTPVKLAGVNRHETDPLTGRAATAKHAEEDARLLRDANFNYVRTSHYPPTREFLDACDRIGLYVECEAPFCWTRGGRGEDDLALVKQFLTPTAAMLDYHRDHPSVIIWSLANESGSGPDGKNDLPPNFAEALDLCRKQDPSRPVIFNNEWSRDGRACDLACLHYPPFPAEGYPFVKDDPRPILIDEYFPPQTFVYADELKLNPGLDVVMWSAGQNSPQSYWSRICSSDRVVGGAIWAGIDEEFYFADGTVKGYGPWGLVDVWRRRKSLWWDGKLMHSPVWIPTRRVDYVAGQRSVTIPIENRYSFTDLDELKVTWELGRKRGECKLKLPPTSKGQLTVLVPPGTSPGALLVLRFYDRSNQLVTAHGIRLGEPAPPALPKADGGCPEYSVDDRTITARAKGFAIVVDRRSGGIRAVRGTPRIPLQQLPTLHVTRRESKSPFNPNGLTYAEYPEAASRAVSSITAEPRGDALAITVSDRYDGFTGQVVVLLDKLGQAQVSFDYTYSGEPFDLGEMGLRFLMGQHCREISWKRQTEWDVYPPDHIGRPAGHALADPPQKWGRMAFPPYRSKPRWPWHLDTNQFGTRDFRAAKYNIREAELTAPDGSGILARSDGSTTVRACLASDAVHFHALLSNIPSRMEKGSRASGSFFVKLLPAER